jgi:stress response protein SCP2
MILDLQKGMSLDLSKKGNEKFQIALKWDANDVGEAIDVDVSAFMLVESQGKKKLTELKYVCYFKQLKTPCGTLRLSEDSRDGMKDGDDESLNIDCNKAPNEVSQINVYINIFKPKVTFKEVKSAKAMIRDENGKDIAFFDMSRDFRNENSILVCAIVKDSSNNWSLVPSGEGYVITDLNTIVSHLNSQGV